METTVSLIIISLILVATAFRIDKIQASMQRQLETQHQQIQALKARLTALEPKDEVDQFRDILNKI